MSAPSGCDGRVVVIGAGPAGLTVAYELTRRQRPSVVLEKADHVGGLARTARYRGFAFDMGGHRFFTKAPEVQNLWHEILGEDLLLRPRLSRIYYRRTFFHYPLKALNALSGLGLLESIRIVASYVRWQLFPYRSEDTFEQWVTNRFGRRLFRMFFRTYTEKVWGLSCAELRAEWAAQRIKDLSLRTALLSIVRKPGRRIRSLIDEFHYPRLGPGMLWDAVADEIGRRGGEVCLDSEVVRIRRTAHRVDAVVVREGQREVAVAGSDFVSSMPLRELIEKLDPPAPEAVSRAAARLTYRDFITVCLIVDRPHVFPDNWLYIHDPGVRCGRIQNFKNWSPAMVPDAAKTSLGLEYFCTEGDDLWRMADGDLVDLARREVERIGLVRAADVEDGCVFRVPKAYPVYDASYADALATVRQFVEGFENLQTIGRNGLHRYNNQDHAMLTGMVAARNLLLGRRDDVWSVNADVAYLEEESTEAFVQSTITRIFPRIDRTALGLAVGAACGLVLFLATLLTVLHSEPRPRSPLHLLAQFFPGYDVSAMGILLGAVYGVVTGFAAGWVYAALRNTVAFLSLGSFWRHTERLTLRQLMDYI
jgi:protoporphyrinogen oxidase